MPGYGLRLIALDLSHTADAGTTWQSCRPFGPDSQQFTWYRDLMASSPQPTVVTLYNEWHHLLATRSASTWMPAIQQGSAAISGFGLFAERAEYGGVPYFNTALQTGDILANGAHTRFYRRVTSYLLLRLPRGGGAMHVEIKDLLGTVLDSSECPVRK